MNLIVSGVPIEFPYEPYQCQVAYMEAVIKCLNNDGLNGALESPTGTGKTLCLLCACLGWIQWLKNGRGSETGTLCDRPHENKLDSSINWPKVIYTSRTHSQLSQVIRELNKTVYRQNLKICLLGSRDLLCVHPQVASQSNSSAKNAMCRAKVRARTCQFFNKFEKTAALAEPNSISVEEVMDIEDLVKISKLNGICPYYKSREEQKFADLILAPYSYLLDPKTRKANKVEIRQNILIFDEAHNLAKVCEEVSSFSLSSKDLSMSIREANEVLEHLVKREEENRKAKDETLQGFEDKNEPPSQKDINKQDVAHLILLLDKLSSELSNLLPELSRRDDKALLSPLEGLAKPGRFLFELLDKSGIFPRFRDPIVDLIDKMVVTYFNDTARPSPFHSNGNSLEKLSTFLTTVFTQENLAGQFGANSYSETFKYFKVYISFEDNLYGSAATKDNEGATCLNKCGVLLNYWCFSAAPGMNALVRNGVKTLLVTSGTLTPIEGFVRELSVPFGVILQNQHVVRKDQTWVGVVSRGPDGTCLNGIFANRLNKQYLNALGMTVCNLVRQVPHGGVLVFFASYGHLHGCTQAWQESGIWDKISALKTIVAEPKTKDQFHGAWSQFQFKADDPNGGGAVLLAVCRGKVSEGIDFADNHGRAVIIAGIPYPPLADPRVLLKKAFLTEHRELGILPSDWYNLEAARAVSQAIGRVIRHKDDFGAVILADQRFAQWKPSFFPSWIKPKICDNFGEVIKALVSFYRNCLSADKKLETFQFCTTQKPLSLAVVSTSQTQVLKSLVQSDSLLSIEQIRSQYDVRKGKVQPSKTEAGDSLLERLEQTELSRTFVETPISSSTDEYECSDKSTESHSVSEGPKRKKIKLITGVARATTHLSISDYIKQVRKTLNPSRYKDFTTAVALYKSTEKIDKLITDLDQIFPAENHELLAGFQRFLLPQHRKIFVAHCEENT